MSEVWTEIVGETPIRKKKESERPKLPPPPKHLHESEELTAQRRAKSLEAIFEVCPQSEIHHSGLVTSLISGKRFEFWPASDTYFIESTGKYGVGIEKLCDQIKKRLLQLQKIE